MMGKSKVRAERWEARDHVSAIVLASDLEGDLLSPSFHLREVVSEQAYSGCRR